MSAALGMMSSFSASFTPSARHWSRPKGPCTLGPMRCCIRATTRRSHQMLNSVSSTRITKISDGLDQDEPPRVLAEGAPAPAAPALGGAIEDASLRRLPSRVTPAARARPGRRARRCRCEFGGHPDHAVGERRRTSAGSVTEPRSPVSVTSRAAARRATAWPRRGRPACGRWRGGLLAVLHRAVVEHQLPGGQGEPGRPVGLVAALGAPAASGRVARSPSHGPDLGHLRRAPRPTVRKPSGRPSSSAMPASTRASGRALRVGEDRVERARRGPPRSRRCRPCRSPAATGKTTSAARVTSVSRSSSATTNDAASSAAAERRRVGRVVGVDPADDQTAELAGARRRRRSRRASRPGVLGQAVDAPGGGRVDAGRRRRRPGGHRAAGSAGSRSRPHRGRRPGAAPRPAWRRCVRASRGDGGERARRRSPAARRPGSRRRCRARRRRRGPARRRTSASVAGRGRRSACRPSCAGPLVAYGATDQTRVRCSRLALRSRRKIVPASSSGSSPTRSDGVGGLEVGVRRTPSGRQHDLGGEERGLLGRVRPGPEVDVVGAERDPGEGAVGVGVLGGEPAAGQDAASPPAAAQAAGGDGERLGPRRRPELAVLARILRVGEPVVGVERSRTRSGPCR